ncbi:adenylate/guanylate cyclase domain-containing protein [Amycolatopsis viridis]|uniref:Adenylate cyclase n=1 Tax=Amycolatopsis viridis TaxID=185678 RepID=A0ABX0SVZ9_9PSEU|nr:adenylate/guanylate cyclase domain-containing protein [Amycolatopsis viridis]NIH80107.1 adenylate cyclase [Amycolatopsis viridis]
MTDEAPGDRRSRLGQALREVDRHESLLRTARFVRRLAPGDSEMGDPLSTAGRLPSHRLARALAGTAEPSVLRELGLTAVQVWQAFTASRRATETAGITILFTDLVGFSTWALDAGDDAALRLLREVGRVCEPEITRRGGRIVKRLGDGLMAVFADPAAGVEAAVAACARVAELEISGHRPSLRAGLHAGTPRKLGHDYLGVDVNVAARVADAASGGQVLISGPVREALDPQRFPVRRKRWFRAKGTPRDLEIFAVETA